MTTPIPVQTQQYAECVGASKRVRWDIDQDVLRGREFDTSHRFLPDSIGIQLPITMAPPGFVTRTISLATSNGLAANMAPNTERVKSKALLSMPCRSQASPS